MSKELKVLIDTREQEPWQFPGMRSVRRPLKFGDYTLAGLEHKAVIERKSAADLVHTMTKDFHRGCREILGAKEEGIELFLVDSGRRGLGAQTALFVHDISFLVKLPKDGIP